jgi:hypothetical protein
MHDLFNGVEAVHNEVIAELLPPCLFAPLHADVD